MSQGKKHVSVHIMKDIFASAAEKIDKCYVYKFNARTSFHHACHHSADASQQQRPCQGMLIKLKQLTSSIYFVM